MRFQARIAIVEDDTDLLNCTSEFLTAAGYAVWGVTSAEAFFRRSMVEPVDIVLLDIGLPGEDGLSVAKLLQSVPSVAVIILSARDAVEDRLAGLHAGADRYLVKPVNLMELAANIDAVSKRLGMTAEKVGFELPRTGMTALQPHAEVATRKDHWRLTVQDWLLTAPDGTAMQLTAREFTLLHHLIAVQGQAVPKKELANEIFGNRVANSTERVNVLLARLRKKAATALGLELPIKTAHQVGYAFTAPAYLAQRQGEINATLGK